MLRKLRENQTRIVKKIIKEEVYGGNRTTTAVHFTLQPSTVYPPDRSDDEEETRPSVVFNNVVIRARVTRVYIIL